MVNSKEIVGVILIVALVVGGDLANLWGNFALWLIFLLSVCAIFTWIDRYSMDKIERIRIKGGLYGGAQPKKHNGDYDKRKR